MEAMFRTVEWTETGLKEVGDDGLPYATHTGVMWIGSLAVDVARLSTGQTVIVGDSLERFIDWLENGEVPS